MINLRNSMMCRWKLWNYMDRNVLRLSTDATLMQCGTADIVAINHWPPRLTRLTGEIGGSAVCAYLDETLRPATTLCPALNLIQGTSCD
jgi:hypothetical protein